MTDPQPAHLKKKPPRADPLQPDKPGSGREADPAGADPDETPSGAGEPSPADKRPVDSQSDVALKNVREGYD